MKKTGIIIIGKIPPPFFGPAVATKIILESSLKNDFDLKHLDTRINKGIDTMGKFQFKKIFLLFKIYLDFFKLILSSNNKVVLIPIAQQSSALYKDSFFILLALLFRKKVILHLRGSALLDWYKKTTRWNKLYFKYVLSKASAAIVLGEKLKYIFETFLPKNKIYVIPNGTNFSFPENNKNKENTEILYFANLMKNKGLDLLLNAIKDLSSENKSKIACKVVGSWENDTYKTECEKIVNENRLPVQFQNTLSGNEKLNAFTETDIFVFTPRAPEGHPWVIVEAMAAGLPIISSDQGAISESVIDGKNGFLVQTENQVALAEKLSFLIENERKRIEMGFKSRELYLQKFTEETMIEKLKSLFEEVLVKK